MPSWAAPRLIQRGELLASLERAAAAKVTLISAPAGGGKTSLLRAWAAGPGSPSELRVLRYLPTNLSRPEIAGELSLSVNTVNTHIRNIYAKLQAQDRSSAVQRARDMRLLSAGLGR
jgi:LuxR family transcriptional regulator, maltose regulon positive regulatory protein